MHCPLSSDKNGYLKRLVAIPVVECVVHVLYMYLLPLANRLLFGEPLIFTYKMYREPGLHGIKYQFTFQHSKRIHSLNMYTCNKSDLIVHVSSAKVGNGGGGP